MGLMLIGVTVSACGVRDFTDVAAVRTYLAGASGGGSEADPVSLAVRFSLRDGEEGGWPELLAAIGGAGKYVSLDLSACVVPGDAAAAWPAGRGAVLRPAAFEGGEGADRGEGYVVSLTLPDGVTEVTGNAGHGFRRFGSLRRVSGANVRTIDAGAFFACEALTMVSFPAAVSVGAVAFYGCKALTAVDLPVARTIGPEAFSGCEALSRGSFPAAESIGTGVFYRCTALTGVNLPAARSIGWGAFEGCRALTAVSLPAAESIGAGAFYGCTALRAVELPAVRSIDWAAFGDTGGGAVTITLPPAAPELPATVYKSRTFSKGVTLRVLGEGRGYDADWQEGFKNVFGTKGTITLGWGIEETK
jgi:hypothetical protein